MPVGERPQGERGRATRRCERRLRGGAAIGVAASRSRRALMRRRPWQARVARPRRRVAGAGTGPLRYMPAAGKPRRPGPGCAISRFWPRRGGVQDGAAHCWPGTKVLLRTIPEARSFRDGGLSGERRGRPPPETRCRCSCCWRCSCRRRTLQPGPATTARARRNCRDGERFAKSLYKNRSLRWPKASAAKTQNPAAGRSPRRKIRTQ